MTYIWRTKRKKVIIFYYNCRECGERFPPDNFVSGFCNHCINKERNRNERRKKTWTKTDTQTT